MWPEKTKLPNQSKKGMRHLEDTNASKAVYFRSPRFRMLSSQASNIKLYDYICSSVVHIRFRHQHDEACAHHLWLVSSKYKANAPAYTHVYRHRLAYDNMCQNTPRHCLIWLLLCAWRQRKAFSLPSGERKNISVCARARSVTAKKIRARHMVQDTRYGTVRQRKTHTQKLKRIQSDFPIFYFPVFVISFLVCWCSCCVATNASAVLNPRCLRIHACARYIFLLACALPVDYPKLLNDACLIIYTYNIMNLYRGTFAKQKVCADVDDPEREPEPEYTHTHMTHNNK